MTQHSAVNDIHTLRVVICGGGASAVLLLCALKESSSRPLAVTVFEPRERLGADLPGFARTFALQPAELAQLASIGETRLHAYVDSLDRKRANEAARLLPLWARALGTQFRAEFFRYARRVPLGRGRHRYRDDARRFARYLRGL